MTHILSIRRSGILPYKGLTGRGKTLNGTVSSANQYREETRLSKQAVPAIR